MILQQRLQVLQPELREQELVDPRSELTEGPVRWREQGAAGMISRVELIEQISLNECQLQRAELSWEEIDHSNSTKWWEERRVDPMDHTIRAEDIDRHDFAVEVHSQAFEADAEGQTLRLWLRA